MGSQSDTAGLVMAILNRVDYVLRPISEFEERRNAIAAALELRARSTLKEGSPGHHEPKAMLIQELARFMMDDRPVSRADVAGLFLSLFNISEDDLKRAATFQARQGRLEEAMIATARSLGVPLMGGDNREPDSTFGYYVSPPAADEWKVLIGWIFDRKLDVPTGEEGGLRELVDGLFEGQRGRNIAIQVWKTADRPFNPREVLQTERVSELTKMDGVSLHFARKKTFWEGKLFEAKGDYRELLSALEGELMNTPYEAETLLNEVDEIEIVSASGNVTQVLSLQNKADEYGKLSESKMMIRFWANVLSAPEQEWQLSKSRITGDFELLKALEMMV